MQGLHTTGQYSLSTRASAWYTSVTLGTRLVIFLCAGLYTYGLLFGVNNPASVCMAPALVSQDWTYVYTFLTSAFFHYGLLHILLNMVSFYPMGSAFERSIGTLNFLYLVLLFSVGCNFIQFCVVSILHLVDSTNYAFYSCSAGFSAVLFCILTIECHNQEGARTIFGFSLPSRFYPWILLMLIQLFMPNVSFYGHLGGILLGYFYTSGLLVPLRPTRLLDKLEGARFMGWFIARNGYITSPSCDSLPLSSSESSGTGWQLPSLNTLSRFQPFSGPGRVIGTSENFYQAVPPSAPPLPDLTKEDLPK